MHSLKFIRKYMRIARAVALDNDACYSRQLGCIIVDHLHHIKGLGYNGPSRGTPHTTEESYLREYFWETITDDAKESLRLGYDCTMDETLDRFVEQYADCKTCPRKLLGYKSGEHNHLCSCLHAEQNAIARAGTDLTDCAIYCWTPVPCVSCMGMVINAGIREVHCLDEIYDKRSLFLLKTADVKRSLKLVTHNADEF